MRPLARDRSSAVPWRKSAPIAPTTRYAHYGESAVNCLMRRAPLSAWRPPGKAVRSATMLARQGASPPLERPRRSIRIGIRSAST